LRGVLVERERELAEIEQALLDAREEVGSVVLVEAPAGKGKSRLLTVAGDMAREADMQVVGAHGSELERDFTFGMAIQLFEPRWSAADGAERAAMSAGPARHAGRLLSGELGPDAWARDDHVYSVIHGLYWLACNLVLQPVDASEARPLVVLVDDAHWADRPSLRFLAYLAERLDELPIALLIATRSGEAGADRQAMAALRRAAGSAVLRPGSLSSDGVAALVSSVFPHAEAEFCRACARITGGNPFLLTELLAQVRRDRARPTADTAERLGEMAPSSVLHAVVGRLEAMSADARAVARAVAVLGPCSSLRTVAELAGLDARRTAAAGDALAAVHLFHPGSPLGFVHPLIAQAVTASLSPLDRGQLHRRAAALLLAQGAPEEQVAGHLLASPAGTDPRAVEILRTAARSALATGTAHGAARMLERALEETSPGASDPELLAELAEAESAAGLPRATERLEHAITVADDARVRARLALTQARALYEECRYTEAADVLAAALADAPDEDPSAEQLEAAFLAAAFFVPGREPQARERAARLRARIGDSPQGPQLDVLAHMAIHASLRGDTRAEVTELASAAWADGGLLEATSLDGLSWPLVAGALLYVGEVEFSLGVCDGALAAARQRDSPPAYAAASYCRAWTLYELGRVAEAAVDAQAGLDAQPDGWRSYLRTAYAAIALCHVQRGALDQAETALSIIEHPEVREHIHVPSLLEARAQLRLAQHRPLEALSDALQAGEELESILAGSGPGVVPWRSTAALAKLGLGHPDGARQLAAAELEEALRIDLPRLIVRNVRILGLCERGTAGLDLLGEAVARGEAFSPRLEHLYALIDYGAALRRANQRAAAREPLRQALDLAHRCGATALAERAQVELAAAGGRPRRVMLSGLDSLTPSERRVGEMAARGLTTRQVAEALFVTPKTVEFHLRHIYRKLGVSSRAQLAQTFPRDPAI
jgi:DNA-binding CsgD family transcriptional regulator